MAGWKRFFVTAAAFNVVVGATFLVAAPDALALLGFAEPPDVLFHRLTGLLLLCFGAVFFVVSRAPERYRALVLITAIGKLGVVALAAHAWATGALPDSAFVVALGDLLYAAGFLIFLRQPSAAG